MEPVIAIIYDCDGTLARDTAYFLLDQYGIDNNSFWQEVAEEVKNGGSSLTPSIIISTRVMPVADFQPLDIAHIIILGLLIADRQSARLGMLLSSAL